MNIDIKLEKKQLECQDGINHAWIHIKIPHTSELKNFKLMPVAPKGIEFLPILNGLLENSQHEICIQKAKQNLDLFYEFVTASSALGQQTIHFHYSFLEHGHFFEDTVSVLLAIVPEEESDQIQVDRSVTNQVLEFIQEQENAKQFVQPPKIIKVDAGKCSPLEKKYRIDGCGGYWL
ncbi:hypothetical protein NIE88_21330 [Sporolactobacillus shoreicorticis]|uniref:Uncharacterized protein n=1 Tax=Sporolactobacillus shoreicorticis TaxID=1923877 RepID=A0ABW5S8R9_9BACL|nr:hypothetical protein [Sporolactobacillus shoreicorticis]MCO7128272.1 hypothetical protein [Sporolactobacillus shoreicorticis]